VGKVMIRFRNCPCTHAKFSIGPIKSTAPLGYHGQTFAAFICPFSGRDLHQEAQQASLAKWYSVSLVMRRSLVRFQYEAKCKLDRAISFCFLRRFYLVLQILPRRVPTQQTNSIGALKLGNENVSSRNAVSKDSFLVEDVGVDESSRSLLVV
jgi:hypothetical protein